MSALASHKCNSCLCDKPLDAFPKDRRCKTGRSLGACMECKNRRNRPRRSGDIKRIAHQRNYEAAYLKTRPWRRRIKNYQQDDRALGRSSLSMSEGCALIFKEGQCYYCGFNEAEKMGLDRMDNTKGHQIANVKVCCEICNMTLTDLPFAVKELLREGLHEARSKGLLDAYIIRTKRRRPMPALRQG